MPALTPLDRVRAALARMDEAASEEGIQPDSYLGVWHASVRELVEALYSLEKSREEQCAALLARAVASVETGEENLRQAQEAVRVEGRKLDRFIERAGVELAQRETATVQALVDALANKMQAGQVIRAKAWSKNQYRRTAAWQAGLAAAVLAAGVWLGAALYAPARPPAPPGFWEQCNRTLQRDARGKSFCAVEVPGQ